MTQRHTLLPTHPRTGLTAVGFTSRGPVWPVLGGSEDPPADGETSEEEPDDAEDADEPEDDEDKPLGPKGEKAYEAEKTRRRNEASRRRAAEKRVADLEAELAQATKKPAEGDEDKPDPDEIRRQIQAELAAETARERVLDKIEVKAARGFADAADAAALLMRDHSIDDFLDDGKPDIEAIQEALDALLESKPYLASAQGGKQRFKGTGDGGAKPQKPSRPKSLTEAVAKALTPSK